MSTLVDWVVAEWVARCVAGQGPPAGTPPVDLATVAGDAERRVVAYTGLTPTRQLPAPEGVSRAEWVAANLGSMRRLMDPLLSRAGASTGPLGTAGQLTVGLAVSAEVGMLVGYMGQRVLGQYELVLLEDAEQTPPRLLFVLPNLAKAVESFHADAGEFLTWVTLHEVTHAVQFGGVPWLQSHLSGLIRELMDSAEVRLDTRPRRRLPSRAELRRSAQAVARGGRALRHGDLISAVTSPAERATLDRTQAVMAVIEGHAEHVMDAVAPELLPSLPKLRAALDARRQGRSRRARLLGRLLGLELKMKQYERGKIFCDAIVAAAGPEALTHVFSAPEALPSLAEIEAPADWLARTEPARARLNAVV